MTHLDTAWAGLVDLRISVRQHDATGSDPWHDVDCSILSFALTAGEADWSSEWDAASATAVIVNDHGEWSPNATSGLGLIQAGNRLKVDLIRSGATHVIFTGQIIDAAEYNDPGGESTIRLVATDEMATFATANLPQLPTAIGIHPRHTLAQRLDAIADRVNIPHADRDFEPGGPELLYTRLGRNALEEMRMSAFSTGAMLYVSRSGKLTSKHLPDTPSTTPDVQFVASVDGIETGKPYRQVCVTRFALDNSLRHVVNHVALGAEISPSIPTATVAEASDSASMSRYGYRSFDRMTKADTGQHPSPTDDLHVLARRILDYGKTAHDRLKSADFDVLDDATADYVAAMEMGDVASVRFKSPNAWGYETRQAYVTGWTLKVSKARFAVTVYTGHPLDVTPGVQGSASGSGSITTGTPGPPGPAGPKGDRGDRGTYWFEGAGAPSAYPPPAGGFVIGDVYLHTTDGEIFTYTASGWHDEGTSIRGPEGPMGPHGTAVTVLGTVPTVADLPSSGNSDADVHFVVDVGDLYIWEHLPGDPSGGAWHDLGHVQGPQGVRGPTGPRGSVDFATADNRYLRLDASNDPVTGELYLTHGLKVKPTAAFPIGDQSYLLVYDSTSQVVSRDYANHYLNLTKGGHVSASQNLGALRVRNIWLTNATPTHPIKGDVWMHG